MPDQGEDRFYRTADRLIRLMHEFAIADLDFPIGDETARIQRDALADFLRQEFDE